MAKDKLTFEEFIKAYEVCEAEGHKNISVGMIIKKTQKGSMSTHLMYRQRLLKERELASKHDAW